MIFIYLIIHDYFFIFVLWILENSFHYLNFLHVYSKVPSVLTLRPRPEHSQRQYISVSLTDRLLAHLIPSGKIFWVGGSVSIYCVQFPKKRVLKLIITEVAPGNEIHELI